MYTQKIANILDHIQDHSRSGLENKFLENKSSQIFLRSTGLLYKFLPTNLGVFKPTFYNFYTNIKNFQNHPYGQLVLVSLVRAVSVVECLNELFFFLLFNGFSYNDV